MFPELLEVRVPWMLGGLPKRAGPSARCRVGLLIPFRHGKLRCCYIDTKYRDLAVKTCILLPNQGSSSWVESGFSVAPVLATSSTALSAQKTELWNMKL
jgi:hypothetical protein